MNRIDIDSFLNTYIPKRFLLKETNIVIAVNDSTYLPDGELLSGWMPNLYSAISKNTFDKRINSMAIVGVGPAVEALLFIEKLGIKKLFCFDINEGVLAAATSNIRNNLKDGLDLDLFVAQSDLLEYLLKNRIKVNLIYENLPNLITQVVLSDNKTASFYRDSSGMSKMVPELYSAQMLSLHYKFLQQAKECLLPSGQVICCIGARVPITIIKSMFDELGYGFKLLHVGLVQQLNEQEVVYSYSKIEESSDLSFLFLPHDSMEARQIINSYSGKFLTDDYGSLFEKLKEIGFNASDAYTKVSAEGKIDHIGLVIEGTLK